MNPEKKESLFCLQAVSLWVSYYTLLNSNGFCQVSGFIHVTAASHCHIVGEQLQRNDCQRIGKVRIGLGDVYYIIRRFLNGLVAFNGDCHNKGSSCFYFYHITDGLLEQIRLGCQSHYQRTIFDQRNRTMFQFSGCISLRMNIGNLFQFQGSFEIA